ncbi:TerD family protein [Streptomyces sp. NPDC059010]|uniref:TerD family protein n=1 Tax=Streptomyces sp. NPDC059010 TaxID=3346695 RepID=UPI0036B5DD87
MTQMAKGANLPVPSDTLNVAVTWIRAPGVPDVDVSALLLDPSGRVRGDADLVFYNQSEHPSGSVRHLGKGEGTAGATADWLWLDLAAVEAAVDRVVVAASADGGAFGDVPMLDVRVGVPTGQIIACFTIDDALTETAFVFGEFYRRNGGWKFRAVGQGYDSGLAGLATDFGITVADAEGAADSAGTAGAAGTAGIHMPTAAPMPAPTAPPPPPAAAPFPPQVPGVPPQSDGPVFKAPGVPPAPQPPAAPPGFPPPAAPPGFQAPGAPPVPQPPSTPPAFPPPASFPPPAVPPSAPPPATRPPVAGFAAPDHFGSVPSPPPAAGSLDDLGAGFPAFVQQGQGKQRVTCPPSLPAGCRVVVEIECRNSISVNIDTCDEYGRSDQSLLSAYEDEVHGRTVALVPKDRPLSLLVRADTPWTLRVLPLGHARRLDHTLHGRGPDLLVYEGPAGVLSFVHQGESNFAVWHHSKSADPTWPQDEEDLLVNEVGRLDLLAPVQGPGLLRVEADGPWRIAVGG